MNEMLKLNSNISMPTAYGVWNIRHKHRSYASACKTNTLYTMNVLMIFTDVAILHLMS